MPINYQIDRARGLIRTRCDDATTLRDVSEHFWALHADPEVSEHLSVLLDLSGLQSIPERDQLRSVASEVKGLRDRVRLGALAIVAESDLLFGMSRVFGVFAEGHFSQISVLRTVAEAEHWLGAQLASRQAGAA